MVSWIAGLRSGMARAGVVVAILAVASWVAVAQVPGPQGPLTRAAAVPAEEISALVAPVALYPDELLAVVLRASTQPVQIVQAGRFLDKYAKDKSLKPNDAWSEPVKILLNYPEVLHKLNDDLDWTERLGQAVATSQGEVLAAVQQFRRRVATAGNLRSDDKLTVSQEGANYVIESVNPQVIYVPVYDPAVVVVPQPTPLAPVYVPTPYPAYYDPYPAAAAAATGFFFGALTTAWAMDWNHYDIDEDDIREFQQSRQQSLAQRQQSRQDAATQRQQARQDNAAQRQQGRQDAAQTRPAGQAARPGTPGGQDLRAALGGERPAQLPGGSGPGGRPGGQPIAGLGADRPAQMPSAPGGFGGRQPGGERPNIVPPSSVSGGRAGDFQRRDFSGSRPGYPSAGGGQFQGRGGGFDYGSGRNAVRSSDRGSYSRNVSGGGRQFSGGGGRGGGGRGGRR